MISVNLIPMRRRQQRQLRARRQGWVIVASVYAVLLGGGYLTWRGMWSSDDRDPGRQLLVVQGEIDDADKTIHHLRFILDEARLVLTANQSVSGQPDWSLLLALLGKLRGDEVVLSRCGLETIAERVAEKPTDKPADKSGRPAAPETQIRIALRLQGYGLSQPAVSQFVLRLERTGLFDDVALVKTNREPFLEGQAMSFKIECQLKTSATDSKPEPRHGILVGADSAGSVP